MYQPNYKLTNKLLNSLIRLEIEKKSIETLEIPRSIEAKAKKEARALNIFHVAHLLGSTLTLKMAEKVTEGHTLESGDTLSKLVINYRNSTEFIHSSLEDSYIDFDVSVLQHLNKILLLGWKDEWDARFRTGGENIDMRYDSWVELRDSEISSSEIHGEVVETLDWFKSNQIKIHPIIRTACSIYRLVRISPFISLNKLTTIAMTELIFHKSSFILAGLFPVARNFDIYDDEYTEAWTLAKEKDEDVTLWIERFARSIANEMMQIREELEKRVEESTSKTKQPFLDLNKRQLKILRYLQSIPQVRRDEYVHMMDVSTMTAYRDLNDLVKKKLLRVEGQGRGTKYMLVSR